MREGRFRDRSDREKQDSGRRIAKRIRAWAESPPNDTTTTSIDTTAQETSYELDSPEKYNDNQGEPLSDVDSSISTSTQGGNQVDDDQADDERTLVTNNTPNQYSFSAEALEDWNDPPAAHATITDTPHERADGFSGSVFGTAPPEGPRIPRVSTGSSEINEMLRPILTQDNIQPVVTFCTPRYYQQLSEEEVDTTPVYAPWNAQPLEDSECTRIDLNNAQELGERWINHIDERPVHKHAAEIRSKMRGNPLEYPT